MKRHLFNSVAMLMGAGVLATAEPALAQSSQGSSTQSASNTVEQVIVTAQKRAENVQDVPLTVTPITSNTIERLHVQDLKDINGIAPNVQISVNGGLAMVSQVSIRGIGESNNPLPYVGTEVTTIIDGVVQGTALFGLANQFDLERVEILAGPQGTLFGANTAAGAVNIVTKQPSGEFGAYGQVTVGNYSRTDVQVGVNVPIIEGLLAGKIAFSHVGREGFYTNLYNGEPVDNMNNNTVRGYLKWTPSDSVDVTFQTQYQHMKMGNSLLNTSLSYPGEIFYRPGTPRGFQIYDDQVNENTAITWAHVLTANWASPFGKVTSITGYQTYKYTSYLDFSGINCYCMNAFPGPDGWSDHGWQISQEIRDVFHPAPNVEVLAGVYFLRWQDTPDGITTLGFIDPGLISRGPNREHTTNLAAFGQVYWDISDRLRLQGGLRVSRDTSWIWRANYIYYKPGGTTPLLGWRNIIGAINLGSQPGNEPSSGEHSWTNVSGKIGADYKINDDFMVYGFYARGLKSGGFNGAVTKKENIGPYNPEKVDAFEAGLKSTWLDRRLQVNLTAFLNKWKEMQVVQFTFADATTLNSVILNAGSAETKGFEVQAEAVPVDGLRFHATLGYLWAKYKEFRSSTGPICPPPPADQPLGCAIDYAGRDIPYSPRWTGSIDGSYTTPVAGGEMTALVQYTYTGKRWGNYTQAATERLAEVGLLNANISWGPMDRRWSIALWGRNLNDKIYETNALDVPPLFTESVLGNPREVGVDFKFNF